MMEFSITAPLVLLPHLLICAHLLIRCHLLIWSHLLIWCHLLMLPHLNQRPGDIDFQLPTPKFSCRLKARRETARIRR